MAPMIAELQDQNTKSLLLKVGFDDTCEVTRLVGGRNNRVFKVSDGQKNVLLKQYFKHPSDTRDRCFTEFSFLSFAWQLGLRCVSKPLQIDKLAGIAVYEFIVGEKLTQCDLTEVAIKQAGTFFLALNSESALKAGRSLPIASEACFSISTHIACAEARVNHLVTAAGSERFDERARQFIQKELLPVWMQVKVAAKCECQALSLSFADEIPMESRRLSPSDFGFHNAIKRMDGSICFIDFEYAGWDDIAKTICDFYLQPVLPVPEKELATFRTQLLDSFADPEIELDRIKILMPVHQCKWICILLNEFLPVGKERRDFSLGENEQELRRNMQLDKARQLLARIENRTEEKLFCI